MYSLGQGMMAANPSMKNDRRGERNDSAVMSFSLMVTELYNISSVIRRTDSCIIDLTSLMPSVERKIY